MNRHVAIEIRIRIYCGEEIAMGPGKADLLEAIDREGSISAAGRAMGMSYRRSWLLVDTMNRCWSEALVQTATGGSHGGGAHLTSLGKTVLSHYRALQAQLHDAAARPSLAALEAALRKEPEPRRPDA